MMLEVTMLKILGKKYENFVRSLKTVLDFK